MLFRHFFAFPPASDMSSETAPRLFTAASSLPAASGLGRVTADAQHHGRSFKKAKSTHKGNRERITSRWHLNNRGAVTGGKVGIHSTKGAWAAGAMNLHLRSDDSTSWAEPSSLSGAVLRQSCEQQVRAVASILYNTNIRRSMTTVWFGIQISPVKAWRSHGKHDSRLYTSSSWFRQKETTAELVTMLASLNDLGDQDRCLTQSMTTAQFPN